MLSRIVDLELEIKEKENTITSLCKEFEEKQSQYEEKIAGKLFVTGHMHCMFTEIVNFGWKMVNSCFIPVIMIIIISLFIYI